VDRTCDLDEAALAYVSALPAASERARARLRERFVEDCLPFAGRLSRKYRGRGEPLDDLEQAARVGLVKAIDRYDPERGSFTAYAVLTISGELKRHFRDTTWSVHVPRRLQDLTIEVNRATTDLTGAGAADLGEMLGGVDRDRDAIDDSITVSELLLRLPARERRMLTMRFHGNATQAEIAEVLGISQMHVSRMLSRALAWLREAMISDTVPRWHGAGVPAEALDMRLHSVRTDDGLTLRVVGEVDRDSADRLRSGLHRALAAAAGLGRLTVDLTDVPLIDAAGLTVLTEAARSAETPLRLVGVQRYVARVMEVGGLGDLCDQGAS
jgi:RNA polymerase sigma-B factor